MKTERLALFIVTGIVAFGFFAWLVNSSLPGSDAAVSKADITAESTGDSNVSFVVTPEDGADRISGIDLVVNVENGTLSDWDVCGSLDSSQEYPFTELISETGSTARYSCALIKDKDQLPPNVRLDGQVTCTGSEDAVVTISKADSEVSGPVENTIYELDTVGSVTVACDGKGGSVPDEALSASFEPKDCNAEVGESCGYDLKIHPNHDPVRISGVYVKLSYDESVLSFKSIDGKDVLGETTYLAQTNVTPTVQATPTVAPNATTPTAAPTAFVTPAASPTASPTAALTPTAAPTVTTTPSVTTTPAPVPDSCDVVATSDKDGVFEFLYTCDKPMDELPTELTHAIMFDAIGAGSGDMTIDAIQVVGPDLASAYSVYKNKATYTIGGSGDDGNIELDLKLRIQCVVKKPARDTKVRVNVGLGDGTLGKNVFKDTEMTFNEDGHLVGKVRFNATPGDGFKIMPKYEYGMRKKICDNDATENYPGAYGCDKGTMTLKNGTNSIDLSNVVLLSGDLPPDGQDGITNAADQALVRNLIGKRDEESVRLADVNYDNAVNQVDHACMIAALAVRWDEE